MKPSNKVTAAASAAATTTLAVWLASLASIDVPAEVQGALTTLLVFAAGWLATDSTPGRHAKDNNDATG